ncbi:MAG TPA: RNA 2',3'-cyclic phosphodiesterase [Gammaproteobacteria bacterium]|nr:RNA 2',3'-cyclic phosphodiesterase [Gammaproteobacteria bacterium]
MVPRAFVALPLCAGLLDRLEQAATDLERCLERPSALRWLPRGSLHLTLAFLGRVGDDALLALMRGLREAAADTPAFDYHVPSLTGFPSVARPRVLAAVVGPCRPLETLALAVREAAADAGLPVERRPFRGHVTLARPRARRVCLPREPVPVDAACRARELVLYRSDLRPEGAVHTPLEHYPLQPAASPAPE